MIRSTSLFLTGFVLAGALSGCAGSDPFAAAPRPRDDEPGREARVRSFADAIADGMARARDERVRELATQRMMDPARAAPPAGR